MAELVIKLKRVQKMIRELRVLSDDRIRAYLENVIGEDGKPTCVNVWVSEIPQNATQNDKEETKLEDKIKEQWSGDHCSKPQSKVSF